MILSKQMKAPRLILVVDDQEINRDLLGMILEDDYTVIYAENGREALEQIEENKDKLSIVLLDLIMPEMDGFEVLARMQDDESLKRIPIIVLTAEKNAELQALKMGAADFITKPFDMHEVILARVDRIIELSEGKQLISAAELDSLTMLYSKNFFYEYAERIYRYHPERKMDAVAINIDRFQSVNATNGREFGDIVLRALGEEIRAFLSETEGIASRTEDDRFAIYCQHQADYHALLERLQGRVDALSKSGAIRLRMGVSLWQEHTDPVTMFDYARTAYKMANGDVNAPLVLYDEEMHRRVTMDQRLVNDLQRAIDEHELIVYYQPKYNVQCNPPKLSSAEALIRWKHPELGMVSPSRFIPLFEGNGQIGLVDNFVWREAARQIAAWKKQFGITIPVSVNVSRVDVFNPALESTLKGLIS